MGERWKILKPHQVSSEISFHLSSIKVLTFAPGSWELQAENLAWSHSRTGAHTMREKQREDKTTLLDVPQFRAQNSMQLQFIGEWPSLVHGTSELSTKGSWFFSPCKEHRKHAQVACYLDRDFSAKPENSWIHWSDAFVQINWCRGEDNNFLCGELSLLLKYAWAKPMSSW